MYNGEAIHLWNGHPPLAHIQKLQPAIPIFNHNWRSNLIDYVNAIELNSRRVIWKDISDIHVEDSHKNLLQNVLSQRIAFLSNKTDQVIWAPSKDGNFLVKMGI